MESAVLSKSMLLLEYLADEGAQPLAAIAAAVGQTRPTAHRLLGSLAVLGYVAPAGDGVYGLTDKLRRVALGGDEDARLVAASRAPLATLLARTGETVNLGVLRGLRVRYLRSIDSPHPLRRVVIPGETDPFFSTALGRVLAAALPDARVASMLRSATLVKRTPRTVVDPRALLALIRTARGDGYAAEEDQTDVGVSCIAAPVLAGGKVVAAVSISGVTARMEGRPLASLVRHVRHAAAQVASELAAPRGRRKGAAC